MRSPRSRRLEREPAARRLPRRTREAVGVGVRRVGVRWPFAVLEARKEMRPCDTGLRSESAATHQRSEERHFGSPGQGAHEDAPDRADAGPHRVQRHGPSRSTCSCLAPTQLARLIGHIHAVGLAVAKIDMGHWFARTAGERRHTVHALFLC